jgi:glyoxylase I family protein
MEMRSVTPLLQVCDMPTSVRFYSDLLGFRIVNTSPVLAEGYFHWVLLRLGEAEVMLNTAFESNDERPSPLDPARTAAHGDTILYFGCPDVDAAYAELRGRGVAVREPIVTRYGMKQMCLTDPDGFEVCFQWPAKP